MFLVQHFEVLGFDGPRVVTEVASINPKEAVCLEGVEVGNVAQPEQLGHHQRVVELQPRLRRVLQPTHAVEPLRVGADGLHFIKVWKCAHVLQGFVDNVHRSRRVVDEGLDLVDIPFFNYDHFRHFVLHEFFEPLNIVIKGATEAELCSAQTVSAEVEQRGHQRGACGAPPRQLLEEARVHVDKHPPVASPVKSTEVRSIRVAQRSLHRIGGEGRWRRRGRWRGRRLPQSQVVQSVLHRR
mmetsp:Transcript_49753/g.125056  ORF Transcript_49753/g.125056 Transcript_49753/m.125056 type:complete len:240 (-) Transcript_49753:90-809(-)